MSPKTIRPGLTAAMAAGRGLLAAGWKYDDYEPLADGSTQRTLLHPSGREITAITSRDGDSTELRLTGLDLVQVAGAITGAGLTAASDDEAEVDEQAWYFTFRYDATDRETGTALSGRYVRIVGTYEQARQQAVDRFGGYWIADQTTEDEVGDLLSEGLSELRIAPPEPDYYTRLAASLREIADQIATLAGTGTRPLRFAYLYLSAATIKSEAEQAIPVVDAMASALNLTAETKRRSTGGWEYGARRDDDGLDVHVYAEVPSPEDARVAELEAELAALRAQVAQPPTRVPRRVGGRCQACQHVHSHPTVGGCLGADESGERCGCISVVDVETGTR
jgi:hypothetical protein